MKFWRPRGSLQRPCRALLIVSLLNALPSALGQDQPPQPEVNLIAMGDWAASGKSQVPVARCLARYVQSTGRRFDALLTAGDNFYERLTGPDDPRWDQYFEYMYDPQRLDFPFFPSLGNHDYGKGQDLIELAYARTHPASRWKLTARWYRQDLPAGARDPLATVLLLDSNMESLGPPRWSQELAWLEQQLASADAARESSAAADASLSSRRWIICCAHHPLFSNGAHGDNGLLQRIWGPLFQKYHVDFYICGHDHDLQHLQIPGWQTSFLLVGGGGARTRPMRRDNRGPFSYSTQGFLHLRLDPDHAVGRFLDQQADELHLFERSAAGDVHVIFTTGTQRATTRPLTVIQGLDLLDRPPREAPSTGPGN